MLAKLTDFMKPSPVVQRIGDAQQIERDYAYWRTRILLALIVGYTLFYFTRKNLSLAIPVMQEELGISKAQIGLFLTLHGLLYGVSKLVNGFIADRTNPRYLMPLGLICSAAMNVCFGLSSGIFTLSAFWMLNGWFQGIGYPPCVRCLTQWFPAKERGTRFAMCNTSCTLGASLVLVLCSFLVVYNWRLCLFVPAGLAALGAVYLFYRLRDTPQSLGLPPVEEYDGDNAGLSAAPACEIAAVTASGDDYGPGGFYRYVMDNVFLNPLVWVVSFANFFLYIVRYSILDWGPTFLTESRGAQLSHAGWIVAAYEVSGLVGMLLSGWIADRVFHGRAGRACFFCMALCGTCVFLFWKTPHAPLWVSTLLLCGVGFFIYGPHCLVAVIAANLSTNKAAATAVGLTGLLGYLSGVFSGWGLGWLVDHGGWDIGFPALVSAAAASAVLFAILWNATYAMPKKPSCESRKK